MKLPPVWACQSTTPVKAKTSAPAPRPVPLLRGLDSCGLVEATPTGSRERGGGRRQKENAGTVWATPLEQKDIALARGLAALNHQHAKELFRRGRATGRSELGSGGVWPRCMR